MRSLSTQVTAGGDQCYQHHSSLPATTIVIIIIIVISAVMLSTRAPTGLETKILASASASTSWPRPRVFGPGLALVLLTWPRKCAYLCKITFVVGLSVLCSYHCNIHYKDAVKHSNVGHKSICVLGIVAMCSYSEISTCGRPRPWPWPRRLDLVVLAETSAAVVASASCPRLTSLYHCPFQFSLSQLCPPSFQTGRS